MKSGSHVQSEMSDAARMNASLRVQIVAELPEIHFIKSLPLKEKVLDAWEMALNGSSFKSIKDLPPAGNPGVLVLRRGDQTDHIRGVTRMAMKLAEEFRESFPELEVDMDLVVAGGLCHDIGKCWEFDPTNRERWEKSPRRFGKPSIRHPAYGAHICLTAGLPEEIAHIATAHSGEGELLTRSVENTIIHFADHAFWYVLLAGGLIDPDTIPAKDRKS